MPCLGHQVVIAGCCGRLGEFPRGQRGVTSREGLVHWTLLRINRVYGGRVHYTEEATPDPVSIMPGAEGGVVGSWRCFGDPGRSSRLESITAS